MLQLCAFEKETWNYACVKEAFLSSCQYTHSVHALASWLHDTSSYVLMHEKELV